jgi:two-component system, cell cycle sensor histidine kinase and response regulator CckA
VRDGVTRAAATARQLLSFAKRNVEELGTCESGEVAEKLRKDGSRILPAHIKLHVKAPERESLPRVGLSESATTQLILTLVQNAREALGDRAGNVKVHFEVHPQTGGLFLKVSDDGPGMPPDVAERVWEPFFTTKGDHHTGLGLSTVWAMVRRQGGEVNLDSQEGVGTTVTMLFPPIAPETTEYERAEHQGFQAGIGEKTVLILEDEAPIRVALRRVLKHTGLKVVEAETVSEAREAIKERRFSLLVSDGVLPDGGAGEFIRDFLAEQGAPVILCSGYLEEDLALEGVSLGQCTFLPKPFNPETLVELVSSLLPDSKAEN